MDAFTSAYGLLSVGILLAIVLHYVIWKWFGQKNLNKDTQYNDERTDATIEKQFQDATKVINDSSKLNISNEEKLLLYGYYKQATLGKCNQAKPSLLNYIAHMKWLSWQSLKDMTSLEAKEKYIAIVNKKIEGKEDFLEEEEKIPSIDISMGPAVSTLASENLDSCTDWEIVENIFYCASIGDSVKVFQMFSEGMDKNTQDTEGRTTLHWAVDREQEDLVKQLIDYGVDLEVKDEDGMTPLAYAVNCEYISIIELLTKAGASVHSLDNEGISPLSQASLEIQKILLQQ